MQLFPKLDGRFTSDPNLGAEIHHTIHATTVTMEYLSPSIQKLVAMHLAYRHFKESVILEDSNATGNYSLFGTLDLD